MYTYRGYYYAVRVGFLTTSLLHVVVVAFVTFTVQHDRKRDVFAWKKGRRSLHVHVTRTRVMHDTTRTHLASLRSNSEPLASAGACSMTVRVDSDR